MSLPGFVYMEDKNFLVGENLLLDADSLYLNGLKSLEGLCEQSVTIHSREADANSAFRGAIGQTTSLENLNSPLRQFVDLLKKNTDIKSIPRIFFYLDGFYLSSPQDPPPAVEGRSSFKSTKLTTSTRLGGLFFAPPIKDIKPPQYLLSK